MRTWKSTLRPLALAALSAMVGWAGSARADQEQSAAPESAPFRKLDAAFLEDSVITAKVKAALVKDLPSAAAAVSVESHRGRVLLSGFVGDQRDARRAREIAASVRGVTIVTSALQIR